MSSTDITSTVDPTVEPTSVPGAAQAAGMPEIDQQQLLRAMSRHWGVLLALGIILGGLGIAILAWPAATIQVLAILTGVALLVSGIFSLVGSFTAPDTTTAAKVLMAISGVLSIMLGVLAFRSITHAVVILAMLTGLGWLMRGILELVAGIGSPGQRGRGLTITLGIVSILGGIAVLAWPGITLVALAWITGIWLLIFAVLQIVGAFQLRSMARQEAAAA